MESIRRTSRSWHARWLQRRGSGDTSRKTKDPGKDPGVHVDIKDRGDQVIIELEISALEDPYRSPVPGPSGLSFKPSRSYDSDEDSDDEETATVDSQPEQMQSWSDRSKSSMAGPADDVPRVPGWKYSVQPPAGRRIAIARPVKRDPPEPEKPPPTLQDRVLQKGRDIATSLKYCVPGAAQREAERKRLERANWAKEPTFGRGVKRERSPSPEPRQYGEPRFGRKPCEPGCSCHDAIAVRSWLKVAPPTALERLWARTPTYNDVRDVAARYWRRLRTRQPRQPRAQEPSGLSRLAQGKKRLGNLRDKARIWCQGMRRRERSPRQDPPGSALEPARTGNFCNQAKKWLRQKAGLKKKSPAEKAAHEQLRRRKRRAERVMKQLYSSDLSAFHLFYSRGLALAGEPVRISNDPYMRVYHQREARRLDFTHRHKRARLSVPPPKLLVLGAPCLCRPDFDNQGRCKKEERKLSNKPGPTVCKKLGRWALFLFKMCILFSIAIGCLVLFVLGRGFTNVIPVPVELQKELNTYIDSNEPFKVFIFNNTHPAGYFEISLNGPFAPSSGKNYINYQFERWYYRKKLFDRQDVRLSLATDVEVNHSSHSYSSTFTEICPSTLHPQTWANNYYRYYYGFTNNLPPTSPWPAQRVISVITSTEAPVLFHLTSVHHYWLWSNTFDYTYWTYRTTWKPKTFIYTGWGYWSRISYSCYHTYSWLNLSREKMRHLRIIPGRENFYDWAYKRSLFHLFNDFRQQGIPGRIYKHRIFANATDDDGLDVIYAVKFAFNSSSAPEEPFSVAFSLEVIEGDDKAYTTTTTTPAPAVTVGRGEGKWYLVGLIMLVFVLYGFQVDRSLIVCTLGAACFSVMAYLKVRPPASEVNKWIKFDHIVVYTFVMTFNGIVADTGLYDVIAIGITKLASKSFYIVVIFFCALTTFLAIEMDNVVAVLLLTPITIRTFEELHLKPQPMLMSMIVLSNTASLLNENGNIFSQVLIEEFQENYELHVLKNTKYHLLNFPGVCLALCISMAMIIGLTFVLFKRHLYKERSLRRAELDHEDLLWYRLETSLPPGSANVDVLQRWFTEERHKIDRERRGIDPPRPAVETNRTIHDPDLLLRVGEVVAAFAILIYCKANNIYASEKFSLSGICAMCTLLLLMREHTLKNTPFNAIVSRIALTPLFMMVALSVFGNTLLLLEFDQDIVQYLVNRFPPPGYDNWTKMISRGARDMILISATATAFFGDIASADFISLMAQQLTVEISRRENATAYFYSLKPIFYATNVGANLGSSATILGSIAGFACSALATQQGYHLGACRYMRIALPIAILNVMAVYFLWVYMEPENTMEVQNSATGD